MPVNRGEDVVSYEVIRHAIARRQSVTATYQGRVRLFGPHALGQDNDGNTNVMAFQYGGESSKVLPPEGEWRCFHVDALWVVRINADGFHSGTGHSKPSACVTQVHTSLSDRTLPWRPWRANALCNWKDT